MICCPLTHESIVVINFRFNRTIGNREARHDWLDQLRARISSLKRQYMCVDPSSHLQQHKIGDQSTISDLFQIKFGCGTMIRINLAIISDAQ